MDRMNSRRWFLKSSAAAATFGGLVSHVDARASDRPAREGGGAVPPGMPGRDYAPVITPNGAALPFRVVDGVKVFHLIAEEVAHEFAPGLGGLCYGFNGRVHGPTIEAVEGDRVRIYVTNRLPTSTSIHWHGLYLPAGMDGVGGLTQRAIEPSETFRYEFELRQHGTFMYHSHHDEMTQMAMGLMGLFVVHPRTPSATPPDRDFAYMLSEWAIRPGARRPDPNEMTDFNVLTLNAKVFPATAPMVVKRGERVRIRIGNLSAMDHHPMHLHGHSFQVVETDGGVVPESARWPETSSLVPVGTTRTIEFVADALGDWPFHCHMTHHVMTQMGHGMPNLLGVDPSRFDELLEETVPEYADEGVDLDVPPNSLPMVGGAGPFGYITMGGMFTLLKVRDDITSYDDPGWYRHPEGTVAVPATPEQLTADGVVVDRG